MTKANSNKKNKEQDQSFDKNSDDNKKKKENYNKSIRVRLKPSQEEKLLVLFEKSGEKDKSKFYRKLMLTGRLVEDKDMKKFEELSYLLKDFNKASSLLGRYLRSIQQNENIYQSKIVDETVEEIKIATMLIKNKMLEL